MTGKPQFVDESPEFDDSIDGSRLTHSSVKFGPTTSSATSARLMRAPKLRTPSTAINSRLARSVTRRIASIEVPGFSTQCIKKSYSRKLGRNSSPRNGTVRAVTSSKAAND